MNKTDLVTMIGNLSQSLFPVQHLITGLGYLLGILFFIIGISKLRKIGDARVGSPSSVHMFVPLAYFIGGAALLFFPSTIRVLAGTAFGPGNILQYSNYNRYDIYSTMGVVIRTAGVIWFVRGCVLLTQASEPGVQEGPKGLVFLIAGVLAVNFDNSIAVVNYIIEKIVSTAITVRKARGY